MLPLTGSGLRDLSELVRVLCPAYSVPCRGAFTRGRAAVTTGLPSRLPLDVRLGLYLSPARQRTLWPRPEPRCGRFAVCRLYYERVRLGKLSGERNRLLMFQSRSIVVSICGCRGIGSSAKGAHRHVGAGRSYGGTERVEVWRPCDSKRPLGSKRLHAGIVAPVPPLCLILLPSLPRLFVADHVSLLGRHDEVACATGPRVPCPLRGHCGRVHGLVALGDAACVPTAGRALATPVWVHLRSPGRKKPSRAAIQRRLLYLWVVRISAACEVCLLISAICAGSRAVDRNVLRSNCPILPAGGGFHEFARWGSRNPLVAA